MNQIKIISFSLYFDFSNSCLEVIIQFLKSMILNENDEFLICKIIKKTNKTSMVYGTINYIHNFSTFKIFRRKKLLSH